MKRTIGTRFPSLGLTLATFALVAFGARGAVLPAQSSAEQIPDITIWDETNQKSSLWQELRGAGDGPIIVLPVYTQCTLSCPVLTRKLKLEAARMGLETNYRVLVFSFDPSEDAQSLRAFRKREQLPANWMLVRAKEADIRRFSDFFNYSIMTEGTVLVHPNQIFLLDHTLHWRATLVDVDWDAAQLRKWMERAESPGFFGWVAMNPEKLAWMGFGGLLFSLALTLGWLLRRRPAGRSAVA